MAGSDQQAIENLDKNTNFTVGVDHMNQVVSFERVIYFGYIQELKKDPNLAGQIEKEKRKAAPPIAFGSRIKGEGNKQTGLPKIQGAASGV